MSTTEGSGASRAGGEGFHNEDAFLVEEGLGLYVVCDGASGSPAGEAAARIAAEALEAFVEAAEDGGDLARGQAGRALVHEAMEHAARAVAEAERDDPELHGLATTVTLLLASGRDGVIGHRGDSRAYLFRHGRASQLTRDHELVEAGAERVEAGAERGEPFDVFALSLRPGDTIVLCTDGAEAVVADDTIARVAGDLAPPLLASRIVSLAHRRVPEQDATAVVVRVRGDREPGWLELSVPLRETAFGHTLQTA
jgi:serine/threonine protein phosphatase PrpC